MATTSWRTCQKHDGMRPPTFRPLEDELWHALDVLCVQLMRDLFVIAKFLLLAHSDETTGRIGRTPAV